MAHGSRLIAKKKYTMPSRLEQVLDTENEQLKKLNEIVMKAIEEEKLLSQKLYEFEDSKPSFSNRLADSMASFGGSWKFILLFLGFMIVWMGVNLLMVKSFDPYPFILLNLLLSSVAAIQAPIIMMSQNRQAEIDRQRGVADYEINRKAELEIETLHQKIDLLREQELAQLARAVDKLTELLGRSEG